MRRGADRHAVLARTRLSANRSSPRGLGLAPLGLVAVAGCCAAHAFIVGGAVVASVAWFGVPAMVVATATVALWWARRRR